MKKKKHIKRNLTRSKKHRIHASRSSHQLTRSRNKHRIHSEPNDPTRQRLQKVLAAAGVDSRRNCEELILTGEVEVNGQIVNTLPAFVDPTKDEILVRGRRIDRPEKVYFLLNKPKNVICTNADPLGRKKAVDLIDCPQRIFCVGRLDAESTGAILLTNDSELANRLTHPRYEIPKTYEVTVRGRVEGQDIEQLKKGVWLAEGKTGRAALKVLRRTNKETTLQIVISQGLNRQVRRMLANIGFKVKSLKRTQIGEIHIKGLPLGAYKPLPEGLVRYLKKETGIE
ncbi:MAG: rRNA pseudouridine synthase [Sedimentisphaerales bacterium]|nr:rRNA pseudouridine synthase [Sedimentisphaerales bacterium]